MPGGLPELAGVPILLKRATERFRRIFHQRGTENTEEKKVNLVLSVSAW